jgi:hypothetical protein
VTRKKGPQGSGNCPFDKMMQNVTDRATWKDETLSRVSFEDETIGHIPPNQKRHVPPAASGLVSEVFCVLALYQ